MKSNYTAGEIEALRAQANEPMTGAPGTLERQAWIDRTGAAWYTLHNIERRPLLAAQRAARAALPIAGYIAAEKARIVRLRRRVERIAAAIVRAQESIKYAEEHGERPPAPPSLPRIKRVLKSGNTPEELREYNRLRLAAWRERKRRKENNSFRP